MSNEKKISEIIVKLSFSGIPPFLQELIIDNIHGLASKKLDEMLVILNDVNEKEINYHVLVENVENFYRKLTYRIRDKQALEVNRIKQELLKELGSV